MIFASNNQGKLTEIKAIFGEEMILSMKEASITVEVEEDQDSFYGNALKKAKEIYEMVKKPVIADDSGLCIQQYEDWPGVMTHRFLGEGKTDKERNEAILEKMKDLTGEKRKAQVVCYLVYYDGKQEITGIGTIEGAITTILRGKNGFGFDELFELPEGRTLAQLSKEEKNRMSARYLAAVDLKEKMKEQGIM